MWRSFSGKVRGIRLAGDPTVPPTRWWNHLYLLHFVWKETSILEVIDMDQPFYVGYIDSNGKTMYKAKLLDGRFSVLHGHEACRFFAVRPDGTELDVNVVTRTTIDRVPEGVYLV